LSASAAQQLLLQLAWVWAKEPTVNSVENFFDSLVDGTTTALVDPQPAPSATQLVPASKTTATATTKSGQLQRRWRPVRKVACVWQTGAGYVSTSSSSSSSSSSSPSLSSSQSGGGSSSSSASLGGGQDGDAGGGGGGGQSHCEPDYVRYEEMRRVLQDERVSARKSSIHGWGMFVERHFKAGDFIVEYTGEAIRLEMADEREKRCVVMWWAGGDG
jgi:hypothetical protein